MSLSVVAACARPETAPAPRPMVPTDGPHASIYTSVTGGLLNRRVDAVFKVDESAYVLVGHLAADGSVDIIYPASPYEAKRLRGPQRIRTRLFDASQDVNYALFNSSNFRFRSTTARWDSYDGSGNGYVFVVASRMPLNYGAFSVGREWDQVSIDNYNSSSDPRLGIREFADELAAGAPYSIAYARAWTSLNFNQYANSFDCVLASALSDHGFIPWSGFLSGFMFSPFSFGYPLDMSRAFGLPCGNSLRYAYFERPRTQLAYTPQLNPSNPRPPAPDPKTTRAWAPRTKFNPRAVSNAYRNRGFDDPFPARSGHAATWSNAGGSPRSGPGSFSNTAVNSGSANGSATSAPAPAKDASGNSGPKTKQ